MRRRDVTDRLARVVAELGGNPGDNGAVEDHLAALERAAALSGERHRRVATAGERLADALDALPVGVVVSDGSEVVYRNEVARSFERARHGEALVAAAISELVTSVERGNPLRRTLRLYGPPRRTLELDARTVSHGPGAVVLIRDVSAQQRLEAVRRDFVANISHELKTPIAALTLLAETLELEEDITTIQRLSGRIVREASRASAIVDGLLELSRVEVGEQEVRTPHTVRALVNEAVEAVRAAAEGRSIQVIADVAADLVIVGDGRQLVSALVNVLDNAVRYSDGGSVITVGVTFDDDRLQISIADTGIGIPSRDLDRIFERFYRVDRARSRDGGGTGLGLAIVRHVVENHGGGVTAASIEGEGTIITLELPGSRIAEVAGRG